MKIILQKLYEMNSEQMVKYAEVIAEKLDNNSDFPETSQEVSDLTTELELVNESLDAIEGIAVDLTKARELRDERTAVLRKRLERIENLVLVESEGNRAKIAGTGMPLNSEESASPVHELTKVNNLAVKHHDGGGFALRWKPVEGAKSYLIQISGEGLEEHQFRTVWVSSGTRAHINGISIDEEGLNRGSLYWIRVAAVGAAGHGPFSEPVSKIAT